MLDNLKIFDLIEIIGGGTPKRDVVDYWGGNIDWLSVKDFNTDARYVHSASEKITKLGLKKSSTKMLAAGDIIISARGTVGCLAQLTKPMAFNQSCYGIRGKESVDNDFLYYFLKTKISELKKNSHGAVFDTITTNTFKILSINLPTLTQQKIIASVLGALDDKIENNNRMNVTLEEMAQVVFKSWFVDFDPVHAKATGNSPLHMEESVAQLFPNSFDNDGLPKGWNKLDIGSVVEVRHGLSYKGKFLSDSGACMINLGCFGFRGKFKPEKIKYYRGDYKDRHKIKPGDLIFANSDMTQDRAILCSPIIVPNYIDKDETIFSHHVSHVDILGTQHPAFKEYLRHSMMTQKFRVRAEGYATGTTVLSVPKNIFDGYCVPIPNDKILNIFFEFISGISKKMEVNYVENKTLAELRDTLLPKLMSGEIRVKDAEHEVEKVI